MQTEHSAVPDPDQIATDPIHPALVGYPALVRYVVACVVFVIAFTALGVFISATFYRHARENIQTNLAAIAALKAGQLDDWTGYMRGYFTQPPDGMLPAIFARWLAAGAPDGADQRRLGQRLVFMQSQFREISEIHLLDTAGRQYLGTNAAPLGAAERASVEQVIKTRSPVLLDFFPHQRSGGSQALLGVVVPLLAHAAGEERVVGILITDIDPLQHLYPMVQNWPFASASAEAVLFRIEGDEIVYLSPLRHNDAPPLSRRRSLGDRQLLAVQAVRQGLGVVDGEDYNGAPAIGVVSRVTGTDWYLLTKMDHAEAFREARQGTQRLALILVALAAAVLLVIRLLWRKAMVQAELEQGQLTQRLALAQHNHEETSEALDRSESMFHTYFNHAMVGMATTSPAKGWIEVNPALCKILGYSREQLLTKTWAELTHPEDLASNVAQFERVMAGEIDGYTLEKRFVRQDGGNIDAYIAVEAVRRPDRAVDFFVVMIEDISARKRAERALVESERRLTLALEAADQAMWDWDVPSGNILVSSAYYRMLGEDPDGQRLSLARWLERLHPADRQQIDALFREAGARGRERIEFKYRMRTRVGGWCWIHTIGKTVERDAEGHSRRMIGINLDITARQQAAEHRQREAERASGMLALSEIENDLEERTILRFGLELAEKLTASQIAFLHFINVDQQTLELAIWSSRTVEKSCTAAFDSHYSIVQAGLWVEAFHRKQTFICNDYASAPGKHDLPVGHAALTRFISIPVMEAGKVRMLLGVGNKAEDYNGEDAEMAQTIGNDLWRIVQRNRVEVALRDSLAHHVTLNRKLEEAQNQLLQSEKMAAIGQLSAGVAHELNNPIGFVNSNLGTLESYVRDLMEIVSASASDPALNEEDRAAAQTRLAALLKAKNFGYIKQDIFQLMAESRDGLERVRRIVQDLKNFSHVGDTDWCWADLHKGLDTTLNMVWNELKYHCKVHKEYGDLPAVYCLPSQINQVFMNLLINAGHAIDGQGEITLRTGREGDTVWVEVIDSGKGIAPENLDHLFEPFFTTKPVGKGTGLGLSLAYGIVRRHQGRIEVDSAPGRGSTFRVVLPIKPIQPVADTTETMAVMAAKEAEDPGHA